MKVDIYRELETNNEGECKIICFRDFAINYKKIVYINNFEIK